MLYKLYAGTKQIDETANEEDIIKSIGECMKEKLMCNYLVTVCTERENLPYKLIKNIKDYKKYIEDYENRQKSVKRLVK